MVYPFGSPFYPFPYPFMPLTAQPLVAASLYGVAPQFFPGYFDPARNPFFPHL